MTTILNVLIGITFVYLIFSLLVSSLNELILSTLDKRSDFLKEGLRELLQNPGRISDFLSHGLIDALSRKTDGTPSYIGPGPFTAAVLDLIKPADPTQVRTIADFQAAVAALPDDKFKQSLSAILDSAGNDLEKFKEGLSLWYDHSMERVSGWYKRYAQKWLFVLGLILAVACNVDSIHITQILSVDPKLAATIADEAAAYSKANAASPQPTGTSSPRDITRQVPPLPGVPAASGSPSPTAVSAPATFDAAAAKFQSDLKTLNTLRLPVGWDPTARQHFGILRAEGGMGLPQSPVILISAIFGWLLTALAGTLGAPFWFDTLNRFINIRANGRSPDEKDLPTKKAT